MDVPEAARLLGAAEREVLWTEDSPAGVVIATFDGSSYLVVPENAPDGAGKTGLMFLAAPTENYAGSFPVYAAPAGEEDSAVLDTQTLDKPALIALAEQRGVAVDRRWSAARIAHALTEAELPPPAGDSAPVDNP